MNEYRLDPTGQRGMEIRANDQLLGSLTRPRFTTVSGRFNDHQITMTMPLQFLGWRWRLLIDGSPTAEARRRLDLTTVTSLRVLMDSRSYDLVRRRHDFEWRLTLDNNTAGWVTVAQGWERPNRLSLSVEVDDTVSPLLVPFCAYLSSMAFTESLRSKSQSR